MFTFSANEKVLVLINDSWVPAVYLDQDWRGLRCRRGGYLTEVILPPEYVKPLPAEYTEPAPYGL